MYYFIIIILDSSHHHPTPSSRYQWQCSFSVRAANHLSINSYDTRFIYRCVDGNIPNGEIHLFVIRFRLIFGVQLLRTSHKSQCHIIHCPERFPYHRTPTGEPNRIVVFVLFLLMIRLSANNFSWYVRVIVKSTARITNELAREEKTGAQRAPPVDVAGLPERVHWTSHFPAKRTMISLSSFAFINQW